MSHGKRRAFATVLREKLGSNLNANINNIGGLGDQEENDRDELPTSSSPPASPTKASPLLGGRQFRSTVIMAQRRDKGNANSPRTHHETPLLNASRDEQPPPTQQQQHQAHHRVRSAVLLQPIEVDSSAGSRNGAALPQQQQQHASQFSSFESEGARSTSSSTNPTNSTSTAGSSVNRTPVLPAGSDFEEGADQYGNMLVRRIMSTSVVDGRDGAASPPSPFVSSGRHFLKLLNGSTSSATQPLPQALNNSSNTQQKAAHVNPLTDWVVEMHHVFDLVTCRGYAHGESFRTKLACDIARQQARNATGAGGEMSSTSSPSAAPPVVDCSMLSRAQSLSPANVRDCLTARTKDPWSDLQNTAVSMARSIVATWVSQFETTSEASSSSPFLSRTRSTTTPDGILVYHWNRRVAGREFLKVYAALAASRHTLLLPAWIAVPFVVNVAWNGELYSVVWLPPIRDPIGGGRVVKADGRPSPIETAVNNNTTLPTSGSPSSSSTATLLTAVSETMKHYFQSHRFLRKSGQPLWSFYAAHDDILYVCPGRGFTGIPCSEGSKLRESSIFERLEYVFLDTFAPPAVVVVAKGDQTSTLSSGALPLKTDPPTAATTTTSAETAAEGGLRTMAAIQQRLVPMLTDHCERIVAWLTSTTATTDNRTSKGLNSITDVALSSSGQHSGADVLSSCFHTCGVRMRSMLIVRSCLLHKIAAEKAAASQQQHREGNKRSTLPPIHRARALEDVAALILSEVVARATKSLILRMAFSTRSSAQLNGGLTGGAVAKLSQSTTQQQQQQRHQRDDDDVIPPMARGINTTATTTDDPAAPAEADVKVEVEGGRGPPASEVQQHTSSSSSSSSLAEVATTVLKKVLTSRKFIVGSLLPQIYRKFDGAHDVVLDMDQISLSVIVRHLERALGLHYRLKEQVFELPQRGQSAVVLHAACRAPMDTGSMLRNEAVVSDQVAAAAHFVVSPHHHHHDVTNQKAKKKKKLSDNDTNHHSVANGSHNNDGGAATTSSLSICTPTLLSLYFAAVAVQNSIPGSENVLSGSIRRAAVVLRMLTTQQHLTRPSASSTSFSDESYQASCRYQQGILLGLTAGSFTGNDGLLRRMLEQCISRLPSLPKTMMAMMPATAPLPQQHATVMIMQAQHDAVVWSLLAGHLLQCCSRTWSSCLYRSSSSHQPSHRIISGGVGGRKYQHDIASGERGEEDDDGEKLLCSTAVNYWISSCLLTLTAVPPTTVPPPTQRIDDDDSDDDIEPIDLIDSDDDDVINVAAGDANTVSLSSGGTATTLTTTRCIDALDVLSAAHLSEIIEWIDATPPPPSATTSTAAPAAQQVVLMMEQFRAVTAWCSPRGPAVIPLLERLCQNHTDDAERSAGIRECLLIRDRYSRWCVIRAALLSGVLVASIQYVLPITTISSAANSLSLPPASSSSSSRRLLKCERMFTWHWLASSIQLLNLVMTTPSPHTAIIIKNMAAAVAHTLSVLEIVDARQRTRDVVGSSRRRTVEDSIWELFKDETVLPRRPSLKCTNAYQSGLLTLPLAPAVPAGSRTPSANDLFTQYIPHLLGSVPHNNDAGVKSMLEALEWCVACTLWNQSERVVLQDSEASLRATIAEEEYEKETQSMLRLLTNGQNEIERFNEAIRLDAEVKKREADRKQAEDAAKRDEAARLLAEELQKKEELCRREADERKRRGDEQQQQQRFSQGIEIVQEVRRKSVAQRAKNMIETMLLKSAANARENLRQKAEADAEQQARSSALEEIRTRIEDRRKSSAHELARSLTLQKVTSMRNAKIATEVAQLEYNIERLVSEAHKKLQRTYDDCEKELHSLRKTAEKSRLQIVKAFEMQQRKEQQQQQAALLATAISSSAQSFVKYWSVLEVDEDDDEQQTPPPSSSQQQRQHLHTPSSAREHHQAARKRGSTVALDEALRAVMAKVVVVVTPKNNNTNMASSDVEREILDSRSSSNHRLAPQALKSFRTLQKGGGSQLQLQYVLKQHAESSVRKLMKAFPSLVALLDGLCSVVAPPPPGDNNGRFVANSSASSSSDLQRRNRLSTIPLHQQEAALLDRIERLQHGSNINGGGSVSVATSSSVRSVSGNGGGAEAAALQASSFVDSTEVMQSIVNDVATSFCTCQVTRASVTSALRILGTIAPVLSSPSRHHHRGRSNHHQLLTEVHRLQLLVTAQHLWMVPCKDSSLQVSLLPVASKLMEQTARDLLNSSGGGGGVKGNDHRDEDGDEEESLHRIPCTLLTVAALCLSITTPAGEDTAVVASWRAVSWIRLMCQLTLDVMLLKHEEAPASSTQRHQAPPPPQPPLVQFLTMSSTRSSPRSHANYQFNNNDDPNYHHQSYLAHHRDHFHQLASKSLHIALQSNLPHNAPPQRSSYERRMFDIRFENNNNTHEEHPLRLRDDVDEGNATTNAVATTGMKAAFDAFQISIGACVSTFVSLHSFAKQQQQQQAQEQLQQTTDSAAPPPPPPPPPPPRGVLLLHNIHHWLGPLMLLSCRFLATSLEIASLFPHALETLRVCEVVAEALYGASDPRVAECKADTAEKKHYLQELAFLQCTARGSNGLSESSPPTD